MNPWSGRGVELVTTRSAAASQDAAPTVGWCGRWNWDRLARAVSDPAGTHVVSLEAVFSMEAAGTCADGFCYESAPELMCTKGNGNPPVDSNIAGAPPGSLH